MISLCSPLVWNVLLKGSLFLKKIQSKGKVSALMSLRRLQANLGRHAHMQLAQFSHNIIKHRRKLCINFIYQ